MEDSVFESHLAGPSFQKVQVFTENNATVILVESQFPTLIQERVEHGSIHKEENVGIELRDYLCVCVYIRKRT